MNLCLGKEFQIRSFSLTLFITPDQQIVVAARHWLFTSSSQGIILIILYTLCILIAFNFFQYQLQSLIGSYRTIYKYFGSCKQHAPISPKVGSSYSQVTIASPQLRIYSISYSISQCTPPYLFVLQTKPRNTRVIFFFCSNDSPCKLIPTTQH